MTQDRRTDAFDAFFHDEFPRLVTMLTAWSGDPGTAEDLAQEALLQAQRRWPAVVALDNPGTWVRRVALNRSANEGRRRRRERGALARLRGQAHRPTDGGPAGSDPTADDVPDAELWARVRALPRAQRDAIVLRYVDDLPLHDIAEVLGCGEGTVKTHLQRGRRRLADHLDARTDGDAR